MYESADSLPNVPIAVSDCGQYLSYCTIDGQLKIWDTLSGQLKQEYTPSSHLSATCVTISWPQRQADSAKIEMNGSPKKKRKRKTSEKSSDVSEEIRDLELLALGTANGNILLYSIVKSDLHSQLKNGHEDRVNDISWLPEVDSLFSCSNDKQVIEWSISSSKVKKKWNPDNKTISSIRAIDSKNILIAGNSIKWLDWENKTILRSYSGHASEVRRLKHIKLPDSDQIFGSYFLSSAVGDRVISAWQLKDDVRTRSSSSLASFSLDDEPISIDISKSMPKQPILITAVSRSGLLYIFEHVLNGHRKTPISHKVRLQIVSEVESKKVSAKQINIIGAQMCSDHEILLVYGSLIQPVFERITYETCKQNEVLYRKESLPLHKPSLLVDSGFTKIKSPLKPKNATVVGPAGIVPTRQTVAIKPMEVVVNNVNEIKTETKTKIKNEISLSLEERLRISDSKEPVSEPQTSSASIQPSSDSLAHVLVQGLQSKDKLMLETVLNNNDDKIIRNTIKKLPIDCIALLLSELQTCLFNKSENTLIYTKWMEQLLNLRLTFLLTIPNLEEEFAPMIQLLKARTSILDRIYKLKGRLNLMISQIRMQNNSTAITRNKPKIQYDSSSSSEESDIDDEDMMDDKFKDSDESTNEGEGDKEEDEELDQQSSDESMDEDNDNMMSDDTEREDDYDSSKLNDELNDIETD